MARGLFRLWLVLSLVWVTAIFMVWPPQAVESRAAFDARNRIWAEELDRNTKPGKERGYTDAEVGLLPETNAPIYQAAFFPPLVIFAIGAGLVWVVRGFRKLPRQRVHSLPDQ